jgi:hypothetical protein
MTVKGTLGWGIGWSNACKLLLQGPGVINVEIRELLERTPLSDDKSSANTDRTEWHEGRKLFPRFDKQFTTNTVQITLDSLFPGHFEILFGS